MRCRVPQRGQVAAAGLGRRLARGHLGLALLSERLQLRQLPPNLGQLLRRVALRAFRLAARLLARGELHLLGRQLLLQPRDLAGGRRGLLRQLLTDALQLAAVRRQLRLRLGQPHGHRLARPAARRSAGCRRLVPGAAARCCLWAVLRSGARCLQLTDALLLLLGDAPQLGELLLRVCQLRGCIFAAAVTAAVGGRRRRCCFRCRLLLLL